VAETEQQVIRHLDAHLARLPEQDAKSRTILEQMRTDEAHHATTALAAGGATLPEPIRQLMALTSKAMTTAAYWL
jgi:ubiquinone biosynthesis monooxygenase Coq7